MKSDISVSINASLREADHVSGSASALFVGGFSILEMGKVATYLAACISYSSETLSYGAPISFYTGTPLERDHNVNSI